MSPQTVVGLRLKRLPYIADHDAANFQDLGIGEYVIVDTDKCREAARVIVAPQSFANFASDSPLRPVLRRASAFDLSQWQQLKLREDEALAQCKAQVTKHGLPMKLLEAEYNFDGSHLTFYFIADGRVDFRGLVKDLTTVFPARVELWQIGPRDRAKLVGGISGCGRELCCEHFLNDFPKSTIKMAKDQDMPLGPNAATGFCGRPLCCLAYEESTYQAAKGRVPRLGETVKCERGLGRVIARNVLVENVTVQFEDGSNATLATTQVERVGNAYPSAKEDDGDAASLND